MLHPGLTRRLFVVLLGNNNHGKTQMIRSLVRQAERRDLQVVQRAPRTLTTPWARTVQSLVIPRSYQETLEGEFGSIEQALDGVDRQWHQRDLVVFPSHLVKADCKRMIELANGAGFDAIAVSVLLEPGEIGLSQECLGLPWDERWTLSNNSAAEPTGQIDALGHDLWTWIAAALDRR